MEGPPPSGLTYSTWPGPNSKAADPSRSSLPARGSGYCASGWGAATWVELRVIWRPCFPIACGRPDPPKPAGAAAPHRRARASAYSARPRAPPAPLRQRSRHRRSESRPRRRTGLAAPAHAGPFRHVHPASGPSGPSDSASRHRHATAVAAAGIGPGFLPGLFNRGMLLCWNGKYGGSWPTSVWDIEHGTRPTQTLRPVPVEDTTGREACQGSSL